MSALTKIFVVLLVVVSLLSAAGFIVFVNSTQHFKESLAASDAKALQATQALSTAKTEAASLASERTVLQQQLDMATQSMSTAKTASEKAIADKDATIAMDNSKAVIAAAALANATKSLENSESARVAIAAALQAERSQIDTLNKNILQDELALSDLTNRNDVGTSKIKAYMEEIAQNKEDIDNLRKQIAGMGGTPGVAGNNNNLIGGVPINGVVQDAHDIKGIPFATINVGSAEQVTKGMVFQVIDRNRAKFLGLLTIDSVDLHNATGKLEGPDTAEIHAGAEAKTQL